MKNFRFLALVLACAGAAALCVPADAQGLRPSRRLAIPVEPPGPRPADFIVAVVNSEPITNNEVRSHMLRFEQQLAKQGTPMPPRTELAREVLERLISEKAQLQLARESGVRVDEALVDQAEATVARQNNVEVAELRQRLAADGLNVAQFRDDLRNQVMLQRLRDRELAARARVAESDIDTYLREQEAAVSGGPEQLNLAHILIAVPDNASPTQVAALQARAERVLERARAGEDFTKLASENSDAAGAAATGGQVGLRGADRYPALFIEATKNLNQGGVSNVVRSAAGFHLVKVIEKRQSGAAATSVTQNRARHILLRPDGQTTEAQARAKLVEIKRRVLAGADFAQLARENSQDVSARSGGDLGWAGPGMFVAEFEEVLNALAPGQISDPVITRFGVHLIQLVERRQNTLSQREQRDAVRNLLREKKLDEAYVRWAQEIRGRAYVEFRDPPQ